MTGLNDSFLLADDSMEPQDAPAATVNAFKDTTSEGEIPELRDDIDLIAVATEDLEIQLRDLDLLKENIKASGGMCQTIATEAQALIPDFINDERPLDFFTKHPSKTMLAAALEEIDGEKKNILAKMWDVLINFLTRVYQHIVKFFTGIDLKGDAELAEKARKISINKQSVDFVEEVIKHIPKKHMAVICAIEEDDNFMKQYRENIDIDRKIEIPHSYFTAGMLDKVEAVARELEPKIDQLNMAITHAAAKDDEDCERPLRKALIGGYSINGSEHAEYIKSFANSADKKHRYEHLIDIAEKAKRLFAPAEEVATMRKIAGVLSKQFVLELNVVQTYLKLNKALVDANEKIYAGV